MTPTSHSDARAIVTALGGHWHGSYGTAKCPAHDDMMPSLSLTDGDDGKLLARCHAGCTFEAVVAALRARGLVEAANQRKPWRFRRRCRPPPRPTISDRDENSNSAHALEIWRASVPIADTPVEKYLRERGLRGPWPATLRFSADCRHSATGLLLPAMIAAVTKWPSREVVAVHRTFLTLAGHKAPVSSTKMMLGVTSGGAVRLAPAAEAMAVGEGIETCLSIQESTGIASLAALSANGLEALVLPPLPLAAEVVICADNDRHKGGTGEQAAERAAARWTAEGRRVRVAMPGIDGLDFNDLLTESANVA
jgi:hypothetical protein